MINSVVFPSLLVSSQVLENLRRAEGAEAGAVSGSGARVAAGPRPSPGTRGGRVLTEKNDPARRLVDTHWHFFAERKSERVEKLGTRDAG